MLTLFQRSQPISALVLMVVLALLASLAASVSAQTCLFDNSGSDATNDCLVLARYALGISGAPLTASTRYASLIPLKVKNNIECVGCALDMNGDGQIDTVDTTIIARHLAGFKGASLTAGLALGVAPTASRPTTAAVVSFLASGCATGATVLPAYPPPATESQSAGYIDATVVVNGRKPGIRSDGYGARSPSPTTPDEFQGRQDRCAGEKAGGD